MSNKTYNTTAIKLNGQDITKDISYTLSFSNVSHYNLSGDNRSWIGSYYNLDNTIFFDYGVATGSPESLYSFEEFTSVISEDKSTITMTTEAYSNGQLIGPMIMTFVLDANSSTSTTTTTTTSTTISNSNQTFSLTETKYISEEVTLRMGGDSSTDMKMGGSVRFTTDSKGKLSFLMNGNPIMQWSFTYTVDDSNTIVFSLPEQETPMGGNITSGTLTGILNDDKTSISLSGEFNLNNDTMNSNMVCSIIGIFEKSDDNSIEFDPIVSVSETIFNLAATEFRAVNAEMLYHDTTHDRTVQISQPICADIHRHIPDNLPFRQTDHQGISAYYPKQRV